MKQLFFIGLLFFLGCATLEEVKVVKLDTIPTYSTYTRIHWQLVEYPLYKGYTDKKTAQMNLVVGDHYLQLIDVLIMKSVIKAYNRDPAYNIQTSPQHGKVTYQTEWERQNQQ